MSNDEETSPLLVAPTARLRRSARGVTINRVGLLVLLVLLGGFALYSESQISQLSLQLQDEHQKVSKLQHTVAQHDQVIERFNASVTNSDVLGRLSALERGLNGTVHDLHKELRDTRKAVTAQLDTTVRQLNASVATAEHQISDLVDRVQKDFEQYKVATEDQFSMENSFMVYQLAGTFTLLSCLISMWHMSAHLRKLNQPQVQRKILAILWMSPIYAVTSWFSLVFHSAEGYLAIIKDFYEAYVIYQFLSFCIAVLGKGDRNAVVDLLARHADHLTPPFRLLDVFSICGCCRREAYESNRQLADEILLQCQVFALQFVFLRPFTTTAMVVLGKLEYYGAGTGPTDYRAPQFYIVIVQNISIFVAFTGLLKFYHAVDQDLAWCRPFAKFLCIKGVVFMTFWQGLAISILAEMTDVGGSQSDEWAQSAQNFLICLEMLLFSIAHFYCFPTEEWEEGYRVKHAQGKFGDSIALGDFFDDIKLILKANAGKKKKKRKSSSPTIPEGAAADDEEGSSTDAASLSNDDQPTSLHSSDNQLDAAELAIAEALEGSLLESENEDDPDIEEAKKRLLDNKMLSPEFFEAASDEENADDEDDDGTGAEDSNAMDAVRKRLMLSGDASSGDDNDVEEARTTDDDHQYRRSPENVGAANETSVRNDGAEPNERTSLLLSPPNDGGTSFIESLRPSIFTTVASIAEIERRKEEDVARRNHNGNADDDKKTHSD